MSPNKIFHNEDCTNFFYFNTVPKDKAGEIIDKYYDTMADAGIDVLLLNTNARRTVYASKAWEPFWGEIDLEKPDSQPFLKGLLYDDLTLYKSMITNMLEVHRQGIDYPARVIERCRHNGVSPWISLRMNDCHDGKRPKHPFHGSFWKENPQFARQGYSDYFAFCLDYAQKAVRDHYQALIEETLERYDIDGLELDFMREPYLFSKGDEVKGAPILTKWLSQIRNFVRESSRKRGHEIQLAIRVPSSPDTALGLGMDVPSWIKKKILDVLIVAPRWATLEFNMPIEKWRKMLDGSSVLLAGGLEVLYRSSPEDSPAMVTPELALGAAVSVLAKDADILYLFNYFQDNMWNSDVYRKTIRSMKSIENLLEMPRRVGITYQDVTAPGENSKPALPLKKQTGYFSMYLGPIQKNDKCFLSILFDDSPDYCNTNSKVKVDGALLEMTEETHTDFGSRNTYEIPVHIAISKYDHDVEIQNNGEVCVKKVEMLVKK